MYEAFESILGPKIMGTDPSGSERSESEIAIPKVIGILREILGTEELAEMRSVIIDRSLKEAKK